MTKQPPVRVGIVGCGYVMHGTYMPELQKLQMQGKAEVVIACDLDETKRHSIRDRFGIENFTTDHQEVAESEDVDLVLVITAGPTHFEPARAALEAGKNVLVEKPMATSLEDGAVLVELAKQGPGFLVAAPHVLLSPTYRIMWNRIKNGDIGQVRSARALYGQAGLNWTDWYYMKGAGALIDLGVYNLVSLTGIFGPAKRVFATMGIADDYPVNDEMVTPTADDNTHVLLDFGQAVFAAVTTGYTLQKYRCPALEIYGNTGTIQMMGNDWKPVGYELWQNEVGAWQVFAETAPQWHWNDGLRHLVECIQQDQEPIIQPEHAYHVLEIMLKAQESGATGRAIELESTFTMPDLSGTVL